MILPTKGGPYDVTAEVRAGLYVRYRGIDVQQELALMALWLAKNPASLPLKPLRFVENWLKKCKNNGAGKAVESFSRPTKTVERHGVVTKTERPSGAHTDARQMSPAPPHNGGTASPSMAAYGQTAAGSSTSTNGAVGDAHTKREAYPVTAPLSTDPSAPRSPTSTPPAAPSLALASAEGSTPTFRMNGPRALSDILREFKLKVRK